MRKGTVPLDGTVDVPVPVPASVYLEEDCLQDTAVLAALLVYHRVQNRPGNQ